MSPSIPDAQHPTDASAEVLLHLDDAGFRYGHRVGTSSAAERITALV